MRSARHDEEINATAKRIILKLHGEPQRRENLKSRMCAGSVHMGLRGLLAEGSEILRRSSIAKCLMGPVVIEAVGEGIDEWLQLVEAIGQIGGVIELVGPWGLGALDRT